MNSWGSKEHDHDSEKCRVCLNDGFRMGYWCGVVTGAFLYWSITLIMAWSM